MEWILALPFLVGFLMAAAGVDFTDPKAATELRAERGE